MGASFSRWHRAARGVSRSLLSQQRVAAHHNALAGIIRRGDLGEVPVVEQGELDGIRLRQVADRRRPQGGDPVEARRFEDLLRCASVIMPRSPISTTRNETAWRASKTPAAAAGPQFPKRRWSEDVLAVGAVAVELSDREYLRLERYNPSGVSGLDFVPCHPHRTCKRLKRDGIIGGGSFKPSVLTRRVKDRRQRIVRHAPDIAQFCFNEPSSNCWFWIIATSAPTAIAAARAAAKTILELRRMPGPTCRWLAWCSRSFSS